MPLSLGSAAHFFITPKTRVKKKEPRFDSIIHTFLLGFFLCTLLPCPVSCMLHAKQEARFIPEEENEQKGLRGSAKRAVDLPVGVHVCCILVAVLLHI